MQHGGIAGGRDPSIVSRTLRPPPVSGIPPPQSRSSAVPALARRSAFSFTTTCPLRRLSRARVRNLAAVQEWNGMREITEKSFEFGQYEVGVLVGTAIFFGVVYETIHNEMVRVRAARARAVSSAGEGGPCARWVSLGIPFKSVHPPAQLTLPHARSRRAPRPLFARLALSPLDRARRRAVAHGAPVGDVRQGRPSHQGEARAGPPDALRTSDSQRVLAVVGGGVRAHRAWRVALRPATPHRRDRNASRAAARACDALAVSVV